MIDLLSWLVALECLGILSFPFAFKLFPSFPDRGYALQKIIGLILVSYCVWLIGSFRSVTAATYGLFFVLSGLGIVSIFIIINERREILRFFRNNWLLVGTIEGIFALVFLGWALLHSYDPHIEHTEQIMDFAFLTSSSQSLFFPPEDPWLRGFTLNYYYFGYLIFSTLGKIAGTSTPVTYNLALASIPALSASAILGIVVSILGNSGFPIKKSIWIGVAGVGIFLFVVNLEPFFELIHSLGYGWAGLWEILKVPGLGAGFAESGIFPAEGWWWWKATRIINTTIDGNLLDYGINEFPFFSFLLGDFHPHMIAIPFTFLIIASSLNIFFERSETNFPWMLQHAGQIFMMGLFLGGLGFINGWSLPPLLFLVSLFSLGKVVRDRKAGRIWRDVSWYLGLVIVLAFLSVALFLPYYMNLDAIPLKIQLVRDSGTQIIHSILLWGGFTILAFPSLFYFLSRIVKNCSGSLLIVSFGISILPLLPTLLFNPALMFASATIISCFFGLWVSVYTAIQSLRAKNEEIGFILSVFLIFSILLILGPELYIVSDAFQNRMNTIFKLHYQAWIVFALLSPLLLFYPREPLFGPGKLTKILKPIWYGCLSLIVLLSGYYGVGSSIEKTNGFSSRPSLDGLSKVKSDSPGEFALIEWLLENVQPDEGLVEAVGPDYSNFGRISASTGVSTILGWVGHERQWRGPHWNPSERLNDVRLIYESSNKEEVLSLLKKYDIRYVVLGPRERSAYSIQNLAGMTEILGLAFSAHEFSVYRLKADEE